MSRPMISTKIKCRNKTLLLAAICGLATLCAVEGAEVKKKCDKPWRTFRNVCFMFSDTNNQRFNEAQSVCYKLGGFLASIRSSAENGFIIKTIQGMGSSYQRVRWFVGLYQYDPADNLKYRWMDGSVSNFRNWMPTQPNSVYERCAMLDGSNGFKWRDDVCTNRALFICRKDLEDQGSMKCFKGRPPAHQIVEKKGISVTECLEHCRGLGFPLAGLIPNKCYCIENSTLDKMALASRLQCNGNCDNQHCGNKDFITIYNLTYYKDTAESCEDLGQLGFSSPSTYVTKVGDEEKLTNCFSGEDESSKRTTPMMTPAPPKVVPTTEPTTTTTAATTTTTEPTTTTTQEPTTTEEPTTTPEPTTTQLPTTTTTERTTTTTPMTTTTTTVATTTTTKATTTTTPKPTTTKRTTTTKPPTTTIPPTTTPDPLDTRYGATTSFHLSDLTAAGTPVYSDGPVHSSEDGPEGFGNSADFGDNDEKPERSCLKMNDLTKSVKGKASEEQLKCWRNPINCKYGFSASIFAKLIFDRKDESKRYLFSTGGDVQGIPGVAVYYKGIYVNAVVSTGENVWSIYVAGLVLNDTWSNVAFTWDLKEGLELYVNGKRKAYVKYPDPVPPPPRQPMKPLQLTVGCRRQNKNTYEDFVKGKLDEFATWQYRVPPENASYFLGGMGHHGLDKA